MKRLLIGIFFSLIYFLSTGQNNPTFIHPYLCPSDSLDITNYKPNTDTTVYHAIQTVFGLMEPISYFNFFINSYDRKLDTLQAYRPGEADTMRLEINFHIPLTIFRGRGMNKNWLQASRFTFDYWSQLRVSNIKSSPILPPTNAFGFSWDFAPYDNFRGFLLKKYYLKDTIKKQLNSGFFTLKGPYDQRHFWKEHQSKSYKVLTTQIKLMHYSNGQDLGFYVDRNFRRHDYLNGDFSTNYLQGILGWHLATQKGQIYSIYGGYRRDFQLVNGLLKFSPENINSYGKHRILINLQFVSKPIRFWTFRSYSLDYTKKSNNKYFLKDYLNLQFRTEIVYIADKNLNNWRKSSPNNESNFRWGIKSFLKINFLRNRNFGFVFMHYYGRDYHNIRYDNVYSIWHFGLNFKFNKNPIISFPQERYSREKP